MSTSDTVEAAEEILVERFEIAREYSHVWGLATMVRRAGRRPVIAVWTNGILRRTGFAPVDASELAALQRELEAE